MLERYPDLKIVTNERCMKLCLDHLHVPQERFKVVADGDTLSLGDKTLKFVLTPWVHWPETMSTWLEEDKILFSCDFLGSHLATSDLFAGHAVVHGPAKRYYAEIMMPFAPQVVKNLDKIAELPVEIIAPSHGPLYDKPAADHRRLPGVGDRRAEEPGRHPLGDDARLDAPDGRPPDRRAGAARRRRSTATTSPWSTSASWRSRWSTRRRS